jgi:hypothetical protein
MKAITQLALHFAVSSLENATKRITEDTQEMIGRDNLIDLITHYAELREVTEAIKKTRKALDDLEDHMSHEDVPDAFRRSSIKTVNIDNIGRVTVSHKWGCSIADGKKPESFEWLRQSGNGGIIIETVNAQTLAAFAKAEVESHGRELPSDLFTTTLRPYTSITKV